MGWSCVQGNIQESLLLVYRALFWELYRIVLFLDSSNKRKGKEEKVYFSTFFISMFLCLAYVGNVINLVIDCLSWDESLLYFKINICQRLLLLVKLSSQYQVIFLAKMSNILLSLLWGFYLSYVIVKWIFSILDCWLEKKTWHIWRHLWLQEIAIFFYRLKRLIN